MQITKTADGREVTLFITGEINTETAPRLDDALKELDYTDLDLTLDFGGTDYITSAGLRVLLVARKKLTQDTMRIVRVSDAIREIFAMTGFDTFLNLQGYEVPESDYRLSFPALLQKRLEANADATAYVYRDRVYTWRDVEEISQIIAADLAAQGVKKGSHVGLCAVNGIHWIFAFYAIQKLGGIAVLMNPALRPTEVCDMAAIGGVTHLCYAEIPGLTSLEETAAACLRGGEVRFVYDIGDTTDFEARRGEFDALKERFRTLPHADDAGVIIFSSGSTGKPKAILASAYTLLAGVEPLAKETRLCPEDINLAFLPMFHIFGFATGISLGILIGYYSVIPEGKSPKTMISMIEKYKCTVFNTVPTMMLAVTRTEGFAPEKLASLRLSVLGGSATTEEQMKMLRALLPGNHFGNIYGMSENAAISLTCYEDTVEHITRTVGRPAPGLQLLIRDVATGQPVPTGGTGEIFIRSDTMVICYYKLPVEKQPVDAEGWLSTGDLGRLDEDGYLYLVGRTKDLIICGGENISPGEIAEVIAQLPEVADVKVLGIPDEIKGEVVTAAIVPKPGAQWDEAKARSYLAERLAKYKIPVYFVTMERFPLLGSGKVDAITLKKQIAAMVGA